MREESKKVEMRNKLYLLIILLFCLSQCQNNALNKRTSQGNADDELINGQMQRVYSVDFDVEDINGNKFLLKTKTAYNLSLDSLTTENYNSLVKKMDSTIRDTFMAVCKEYTYQDIYQYKREEVEKVIENRLRKPFQDLKINLHFLELYDVYISKELEDGL